MAQQQPELMNVDSESIPVETWREINRRREEEKRMEVDNETLVGAFERFKVSEDGSSSFMDPHAVAPGDDGGTSPACPQMGINLPIKSDEVVYIIASHGEYTNNGHFWDAVHNALGTDHNYVIRDSKSNFENVNFGVLVNTNVLLTTLNYESRQQAVNRHINDIIRRNIKVFRRYPWSEPSDQEIANFPNLIFSEGNSPHDPFKATIARYFNGRIDYFELYRSAVSGNLIPLMLSENLGADYKSLLSQLLPIFDRDVTQLASGGSEVSKYNIVFATCMEGLPASIQNAWTGKDPRRPYVVGGGKLTKYNKRKRQYKKKKKTTKTRKHKKKTRKFKKRKSKKTRRGKKRKVRKNKKTRKRKQKGRGANICQILSDPNKFGYTKKEVRDMALNRAVKAKRNIPRGRCVGKRVAQMEAHHYCQEMNNWDDNYKCNVKTGNCVVIKTPKVKKAINDRLRSYGYK